MLVLAATLSLATSTLAAADDLVADGDGLAPVTVSALDFGQVCAGSTTTKPIALAITKKGGAGGGNRFADGVLVDVTAGSVAAPLSTPTSAGTITMPTSWSGAFDGSVSPSTTAQVTLAPTATGQVNASIRFTATTRGGGTSKFTDLDVRAMVVSCDTTPPVLTVPGDLVLEATGPTGATATWTATATDAAPANPAVTCTPASGSTFALGSTTVDCRATDAAGNVGRRSFTVTVVDTTAPVLSGAPSAATVEATGPAGAVVTYTAPTAADLVDGPRPVNCAPTSGSTFALGDTTMTCTSTDARGNASSTAAVVRVLDTTAPVLVVPAEVVAEATGPTGASVDYVATAADLVDGDIAPTCQPPAGSRFGLGATSVDCSATDRAANATSGSFTVRVVDTTAPVLTLPADRTVEGNRRGGAAVVLEAATAVDLVDGDVAVTCDTIDGLLGLGAHVVTCDTGDAAGNATAGSYTVTVVDTTAPDLTLPVDRSAEATGPNGAQVDLSAATATDVVDGDVDVTCTPGSGTFALGQTTITCTATDASANRATGSYSVEVVDTTGPAITATDVVAEAIGPDGAVVAFAVSAVDLVHGSVDVTCDRASGDAFVLGTTTVTCRAADPLGNVTTAGFDVTVRDTTAPTLSVPALVTSGPTGPAGAVVTFDTTATDAVSGAVPVTCSRPSGSQFGFGDTTITCTAVDGAGNLATARVVVRVGPFRLSGFFQPVDMGTATAPVLNTVKGGSTVPLKFEAFGQGDVEMTSTAVVAGIVPTKTSCTSGLPEDTIEAVATGGTQLRWDATGGQFIYNWQTPKQAGTCWLVAVNFVDGSSLTARFKLK